VVEVKVWRPNSQNAGGQQTAVHPEDVGGKKECSIGKSSLGRKTDNSGPERTSYGSGAQTKSFIMM
jgi:hypothetical protein